MTFPERISKLRQFINNCNWKDIAFPAQSKDWRKFEDNNKTIALNVLFMPYNKKQEVNEFDGTKCIRPAYISKHNNKRSIQVILLMITDRDNNWHYLAVTRVSGLLRGITSHKHGEFYCLNCFRPYSTKNMLEKHEKIYYNHKFCFPKMPDAKNNILKSKPGKKSLKHAFAICADL